MGVDGNSLGKELKPSSVHLQPPQQSLKADCSSQSLLVCSLTFSSSCLCLLDPGNSETCTKSKIQSAQIDLSNINFQHFNFEAGSRKPEELLQFLAG